MGKSKRRGSNRSSLNLSFEDNRLKDCLYWLSTLVEKHDPDFYNRLCNGINFLAAEYREIASRQGDQAAERFLTEALKHPVLLDRRKSKTSRKDKQLHAEYNLILHRLRALPRNSKRSRFDLVRGVLRDEFSEVNSADFATAPSNSDTAYWILARRYTNDNIASLITRLNRARRQLRVETEQGYRRLGLNRRHKGTPHGPELMGLAVEQLKRILPEASIEERRRIKLMLVIAKTGILEVYGKKLEELL